MYIMYTMEFKILIQMFYKHVFKFIYHGNYNLQNIIGNFCQILTKSLKIVGGCPGNTVGVARLVEGKNIDEVIKLLKGIDCAGRGTSCPDQVAIALEEYKNGK